MKITGYATYRVPIRGINWILLKLSTDEGIVGWGECTLEGKDDSALAALGECFRSLQGEDPARIEWLWNRWRGVPWRGAALYTAMSGLEHALWDIAGKRANLPIHAMLGGRVRDRVDFYTWTTTGPSGSLEELADDVRRAREEFGYRVFKFKPIDSLFTASRPVIERARRVCETVLDAAGPDGRICIEGAGGFYAPAAIECVRAMSEFDPLFFEEMVNCADYEGLAKLRNSCPSAPLAAGEKIFTRWEAWPPLKAGLLNYIQLDICHVGGILEMRKVAAMAETVSVPVIPHNPNGPVATAAAIQVAACTPNLILIESVRERIQLMNTLMEKPFTVSEGSIDVPAGPGLGIEMDEGELQRYEAISEDFPTAFANPVPAHPV